VPCGELPKRPAKESERNAAGPLEKSGGPAAFLGLVGFWKLSVDGLMVLKRLNRVIEVVYLITTGR